MNIEKLKGFLKEWKEDRVKNDACILRWNKNPNNKCNSCPYFKIAIDFYDSGTEDTEEITICEMLETIKNILESEEGAE